MQSDLSLNRKLLVQQNLRDLMSSNMYEANRLIMFEVSSKNRQSLTLCILLIFCVHVNVMENLVLVAEDVVMQVVLLWRLRGQYKCLHETTHLLAIVGQFSSHLGTQ